MRVRKRHVICNEEVHLASEMFTGVHFNSHGVVTLMGSSPIVALRTPNPCVYELNSIQNRHGYIPLLGHEHDRTMWTRNSYKDPTSPKMTSSSLAGYHCQ